MIVHIHSDDMGATPHVTERMLACWKAGALTSFSVIANGEGVSLMGEHLRAQSEIPARIACHLNLSEGPSAAPAAEVPLLVDDKGCLNHTFGSLILARIKHGREFRRQVEIEWRAQIAMAARLVEPRVLSVVDGHMHVHMLPFLFPVAAKLARDANIPEIRISHEPMFVVRAGDLLTPSYAINLVKNLTLRACSTIARPIARRELLRFPDRMIGILYTGDMRVERAVQGLKAARNSGAGMVEVVFHVGRATAREASRWKDRDFVARFYFAKERDSEHDAVTEFAAKLRRKGEAFEWA